MISEYVAVLGVRCTGTGMTTPVDMADMDSGG